MERDRVSFSQKDRRHWCCSYADANDCDYFVATSKNWFIVEHKNSKSATEMSILLNDRPTDRPIDNILSLENSNH